MADKLKVAIAAAARLATSIRRLRSRRSFATGGHEVTFYGRPSKLEGTLVPAAGFELVPVEVTGFDRSRPWTALTSLYRVWSAKRALGKLFRAQGAPDVACGFGAYVEVPLLGWCKDAHVPYLLHEQNSVPGLPTR